MKHRKLLLAALMAAASSTSMAQLVGVSWSNFREERWTTDEKASKDQLAKLGATYVSADAAASPEKQLGDIDGLINKGAKVLLILAQDKDAIMPAIEKAKQFLEKYGACEALKEQVDYFKSAVPKLEETVKKIEEGEALRSLFARFDAEPVERIEVADVGRRHRQRAADQLQPRLGERARAARGAALRARRPAARGDG